MTIEKSAKTKEEAIALALAELGADESEALEGLAALIDSGFAE